MSTVEPLVENSRTVQRFSDVQGFDTLVSLAPDAFDALPGATYACAKDGSLLRFNREAAGLWGREPRVNDLIDCYCGSLRLYQADGQALAHNESPMALALRSGIDVRNAHLLMQKPGGERILVLLNIRVFRDARDQIRGAIGCLHDISPTETAKTPTAHRPPVQTSADEMHQLLEALPAAVYTTDAKGRITFFNRAAVELSGRTPALGTDEWCVSWRLYWPDGSPLPHGECPMAIALRDGQPVRGTEAIMERPDGTRVPFMPFPTPLFDAQGNVSGAVNMLVDISELKEAGLRQKALIDELNHRVKNTLTIVQSLAAQTGRYTTSIASFTEAFEARLLALAKAHDLLTKQHWQGTSVAALMSDLIAPFETAVRKSQIQGPAVQISPRVTLCLTMALSELITNAAKYGALSVPAGSLYVSWRVSEDPEKVLEIDWCERGGPLVTPPSRGGFGTRLIQRCVERDLGGTLSLAFEPSGLRCHIAVTIDPVYLA